MIWFRLILYTEDITVRSNTKKLPYTSREDFNTLLIFEQT